MGLSSLKRFTKTPSHRCLSSMITSVPQSVWIKGYISGTLDDTVVKTLDQTAYKGQLVTTPDRSLLACGSLDKTVQMWSTSDGELIQTLDLGGFGVLSVAIHPDGSMMASGLYNGNVRLTDIQTLETHAEFRAHEGAVTALSFSSTGNTFATGGKMAQ